MKRKRFLSAGLILLLAFFLPTLGLAQQESAKQAIGVVKAVTVASNTIVVEVPVDDRDTLTVGAEVTDQTKITSRGKPITLGDVKEGDKVVIRWTRLEGGLVANSIAVKK